MNDFMNINFDIEEYWIRRIKIRDTGDKRQLSDTKTCYIL